jgi:hypothetical protein
MLAACLDSCLRLLDVEAGELLASYRHASSRSPRELSNLLECAWCTFCGWHLASVRNLNSYVSANPGACDMHACGSNQNL